MGEVFLAIDTTCQREVALKRVREDFKHNPLVCRRFLREALIAAQISHPNIMPIYSIAKTAQPPYYTMPYIRGKTLREILRTKEQDRSIPVLLRYFLSVCQAIAYSHSKDILHRDIKPDNIIIGQFGETLILDWGLAQKSTESEDDPEIDTENDPNLTRPGKVVGTLAYMAPERARHARATASTDLYALGAILYQILTLKFPFRRENLQTFRKVMIHEQLIDPLEVAPQRDIPRKLADIACKCLTYAPEERFVNVASLIAELESYMQGRPEWMPIAHLNPQDKTHWEFQENILLSKHTALAYGSGIMEWVLLMVSKQSFWGNFRIQICVEMTEKSRGVDILFGIPENGAARRIEEGWSIRIGSAMYPGLALVRSNIEVISLPEAYLPPGQAHRICVEKIGNRIEMHQNSTRRLRYISPLPITGSHVGLLRRDEECLLETLEVFVGSYNATVNCLAIPDAFLARQDYATALTEYRKIAYSFAGRPEGREASLRAGVTLVEQSRKDPHARAELLQAALEEFGHLSHGGGTPLEFLGKSLVYKEEGDTDEEIKCLELALRKYASHPLRPLICQQTLFRLHESSSKHRVQVYGFALLALRQMPELLQAPEHHPLLSSIRASLERLPIFFPVEDTIADLATQIAFWLCQERVLTEIFRHETDSIRRGNLEHALAALKKYACLNSTEEDTLARRVLVYLPQDFSHAVATLHDTVASFPDAEQWRCIWQLLQCAIDDAPATGQEFFDWVKHLSIPCPWKTHIDALLVSFALIQDLMSDATSIFSAYPLADMLDERHSLFFYYGAWLRVAKGAHASAAHFLLASKTVTPSLSSLGAHFLAGQPAERIAPLPWQRIQLWRQLRTYAYCARDPEQATMYAHYITKELSTISIL